MKNDFIMPIAVLLIICIVITGALAATNELTAPVIAQAAADRASSSMRELMPAADEFSVIELTQEMIDNGVTELYEAFAAGEALGYVVVSTADGFGGEDSIIVMLAVGPDHSIIDLKTLKNTETQGLGSRVSEPEFEKTFIGSNASFASYEAISGATISSKAYLNAVDYALQACADATRSRGGYVS